MKYFTFHFSNDLNRIFPLNSIVKNFSCIILSESRIVSLLPYKCLYSQHQMVTFCEQIVACIDNVYDTFVNVFFYEFRMTNTCHKFSVILSIHTFLEFLSFHAYNSLILYTLRKL